MQVSALRAKAQWHLTMRRSRRWCARRNKAVGGMAPAMLLALLAALGGCGSLLPATISDAGSSFHSFAQAEFAFEPIEPFKIPARELKLIGFDTEGIRNVRLIPYPDLVSRLATNASIAMADLDPGFRDCIQVRMACVADEFHFVHA